MTRFSMGHADHRPRSAEKTLRRCRNGGKDDNVILIDADSDNVIIIDTPEHFQKRKVGSGRFSKDKWSCTNVIYIDDDETPESNHSGDVNNASFAANTSSSREPCHANTKFVDSGNATGEGCQYVHDNTTPVRLSKCKRTYSGKTSSSNHFGLNTDSENDSSDSDYADCELVEDSSGKVQALWEKAVSRRRKYKFNGPSGIRDRGSTSQNLTNNQHKNSGMEDVVRPQKEDAFCFNEEKYNSKTDTSHIFGNKESGFGCSRVFDHPTDLEFGCREELDVPTDLDFGCSREFDDPIVPNLSRSAPKTDLHSGVQGRSSSQSKGSPSIFTDQVNLPDCVLSDNDIGEREECLAPAFMDEKACPPESCVDEDLCSGKSSPIDDHQNFWRDDFYHDVRENEHLETSSADEMDTFVPEQFSSKRSTSPDSQTNPSPSTSRNAARSFPGRSLFSENFLASEDAIGTGLHQENKQPVPDILPCINTDVNQTKLQEGDSLSNSHQENEDGRVVHIQNAVDTFPSVETSIINKREMIKETDEYKRAIEAEWASRQEALAIQAEEAQRLRRLHKRRKAETMRVLDMERRQKQRLEEIRNTQKKDEENMNLKEAIRAEVRNELKKLETTCVNMASLLQLLGVNVNGWPSPSPQQVQTAYRKALLTFHPDRAVQSDMRLQVEAEEKFKLINRMKEKFLPSDTTKK